MAIDLAEELGRPELKVRPLQYRAWARWDVGDSEGAVTDMQESIDLGHRIGFTGETSVAYNNYAGMRWSLEGPAAGLQTYEDGIAFSVRRGVVGTRLWSLAETTWPLFDLGRWDEILEIADEVSREAEARDWSQIASLANPQRVKVLLLRGDTDLAAEFSETYLPSARQVGDPQLMIPALEAQALISARHGDPQRVIDSLLEMERITAETTPLILSAMGEPVRLAVGAGDMDLARRLQAANRAYPGRSELIVATGDAILAEADGRLDEAATGYLDVANAGRDTATLSSRVTRSPPPGVASSVWAVVEKRSSRSAPLARSSPDRVHRSWSPRWTTSWPIRLPAPADASASAWRYRPTSPNRTDTPQTSYCRAGAPASTLPA